MIWRGKSFGAFDLTNGYSAFFSDEDNPNMQPPVELHVMSTGESAPAVAGISRKEDYLVMTVLIRGSGKQAKYDALTAACDALNGTAQALTCFDEQGNEWYLMCRVLNHAAQAMTSKITFQAADGVWRRTTEVDDVWAITASEQTRNITVGGTVEALPIFEITPTDAKTGGFAYRVWVRMYNPTTSAVTNELVDVANGGMDTSALVTAGKAQIDGDDVRVFDYGREVDRFLVNMNSAATKIFAGPFNFSPKIEMTLGSAIGATGSVAFVTVANTTANIAALRRLPNLHGIIEIDSERFIYISKDVVNRKITIAQRAGRSSSAAAHSVGATVKWIEHDAWLYYKNSTLGAPVTDPAHEAAFDIASSTNGTRVYTSFGDKAGARPGAWQMSILYSVGQKSYLYTGAHGDTTADPITDLGMALKAYIKFGQWKSETGTLECRFSHACGIATLTATGEKRRLNNNLWPSFVGLQKSKDGSTYVDQFSEAKPASAGVYTAITNTGAQTFGTGYRHARFLLDGSTNAAAFAEVDFEISAVTIVLANPITATLGAEESNYDLNCEIQNVTTGQSLFLRWGAMALNETLTADGEERRVTYGDGTNAYSAKSLDAPRIEWLPLQAGITNQLKFIDGGTQALTLRTRFVERRKR